MMHLAGTTSAVCPSAAAFIAQMRYKAQLAAGAQRPVYTTSTYYGMWLALMYVWPLEAVETKLWLQDLTGYQITF
jgi:hypothetical protein